MHPHHSKNKSSIYHLSLFKKQKNAFGFYIFELSNYYEKYPMLKEKHAFDFYSIIYVESGSGVLEIEQEKINISQKQLFLISPNQQQQLTQSSEIKAYIILFFQDFYVEEYGLTRLLKVFLTSLPTNQNRISPDIIIDKNNTGIEQLILLIYSEYSQTSHNLSNAILRSYLNSLLLKINQLKISKYPEDFDFNNEIIVKFSQLLENNFIKHHEVAFYAKALELSETVLNKISKLHFSNGVKKLIQNRLMIESRKLLAGTNLSVAEISIRLNFSDNSYFNKVFIKNHKITPGQFRMYHQKHTIKSK